MIFPPESICELRQDLAARMEAGELSEAEVFRRTLAVDPNDPAALRFHAFMAEEAGDRASAERFGRRFLLSNPVSHEGYLLLGRVVVDPSEAGAYRALGEDKLHFDPEARANYEFPASTQFGAAEPESVTRELEPHRLVHQLFAAGIEAVEPALIDRIVARGAECAPLLLGVLNACGEDLLHETDDALVARSLALLGEIGDPAALPAIAKFIVLEDETLGGSARWAFLRIARRRPAETVNVIRTLTVGAEALDLAALAQQLCLMPDVSGRAAALLGMAVNLPELDDDGRALVVMAMITSACVMEGSGSPLARSIEAEHGAALHREARKELKVIRAELDQARGSWSDEEPSIYEVACDAFEAVDEDEMRAHTAPKIGRNDPCWCGSGKKYKKCHLDSDAKR
jgi:hypothetical protein